MKALQPEDPEQYILSLERGGGQPPRSGEPVFAGTLPQRLWDVGKLANTAPGRLVLTCVGASALAIALLVVHDFKTTVHGDLMMINSGAKDTIACNDGNLKLDGDNNTYTVTGHCRRLEVFGGANHVTVDSADTVSVLGDDNVLIYHSGAPAINKTGNNNIVSQRPSSLNR